MPSLVGSEMCIRDSRDTVYDRRVYCSGTTTCSANRPGWARPKPKPRQERAGLQRTSTGQASVRRSTTSTSMSCKTINTKERRLPLRLPPLAREVLCGEACEQLFGTFQVRRPLRILGRRPLHQFESHKRRRHPPGLCRATTIRGLSVLSSQCLIHLTVGRWKFTFRAIVMCTMCEVYPFTTARDSSIRHERILCQFRTLDKCS